MRTFSRFVQLVLHIPNAMLLLLQGWLTGKKLSGFGEVFILSARVNLASLNLYYCFFLQILDFFYFLYSYTPKLLFVWNRLIRFWSMVKLCINRDNYLVPLLFATRITVHQVRKCLKLSILVQFLSARVLAGKQLFIHPWPGVIVLSLALIPK